jgi:hypothetical protein
MPMAAATTIIYNQGCSGCSYQGCGIVELVDDTDVVTWGKLYHYLRHRSNGSKVILISRLDQVSSLGITSRGVLVLFQGPRIWECKPI